MKTIKLTILLIIISLNVVKAQHVKLNENNCVELSIKDLTAIGFVIDEDNIRYECFLPGGITFFFEQTMNSFSTMLMNNDDLRSSKYFPVLISSMEGEVFFSYNIEEPNPNFLPIILKTNFYHKGSNKQIFVFRFDNELKEKLPEIDIDKYLIKIYKSIGYYE